MIKVFGSAIHAPEKNSSEAPDYFVEIPDLELYTQAESLDDALEMARDVIKLMFKEAGIKSFAVDWENKDAGSFSVRTSDIDGLLAFVMKRKRHEAGITLQELAKKMGFKSHNSVAAYEMADRSPTVGKFAEIAEGLGYELVISLQKKGKKSKKKAS